MELIRISLLTEDGRPIVILEGNLDRVGIVLKVEDTGIVLLWISSVETGQRLHRLDTRERLVHIHGVEKRLVIAGLKLVSADQEAVWLLADALWDEVAGETVE